MILYVSRYAADSPVTMSIIQKLIEQKISFTGWSEDRLPSEIPDDFERYPAMIADTEILKEAKPEMRKRLEHYASEHFLFPIPQPDMVPPADSVFCQRYYESEIGLFIASAGLEPEELPQKSEKQILNQFLYHAENFFADIGKARNFNEYHLHFLQGMLALENTEYAPADWTGKLNNVMHAMFRVRNIYGHHDQMGAWIYAPFYADRTGEREPAEWMLRFFDEILKRRPRTPEGILSPGGFTDDPLYYSGIDTPEFGFATYTVVCRDLVTNENMHFTGGAFAAATRFSGDMKYLNEAVKLLDHIERVHRDPKDNLLFHASRNGKHIGEKWGRGNGHALIGAFYMLWAYPDMPEEIRRKVVTFLDRTGEGLIRVQAPSGLWHNVLSHPDSAEETSCTVLFCYIYSWLANCGYVSAEKYRDMILRARHALRRLFWCGKGVGNCTGTWPQYNAPGYYMRRPHHIYIMPLIVPALLESEKLLQK